MCLLEASNEMMELKGLSKKKHHFTHDLPAVHPLQNHTQLHTCP
jgi:hypothetical protein